MLGVTIIGFKHHEVKVMVLQFLLFNRAMVKSDSAEHRKQLGGKRPELVFEALVSFKRM